ncbi:MAG TPA: hypothetical protein VE913_15405 [Longimicrobium sp.]|nr:hypothetical protein [Longimicrobium sp.]
MKRIQDTILPLAMLAACGDGAGDVATEQPGTPAAPTPPTASLARQPEAIVTGLPTGGR